MSKLSNVHVKHTKPAKHNYYLIMQITNNYQIVSRTQKAFRFIFLENYQYTLSQNLKIVHQYLQITLNFKYF